MALYPFFTVTVLPQTHNVTSVYVNGSDLTSSLQYRGMYTDADNRFIRGWTVEAPGLSEESYNMSVQVITGDGDSYKAFGEMYYDATHTPDTVSGMNSNTTVYNNDTIGMIVAVRDSGVLDTVTVSYPMRSNGYALNSNATVTITHLDPVSTVDSTATPVNINNAQVIIRDWTRRSQNYNNGLLFNTTPPSSEYDTYVEYAYVGQPEFTGGNYGNSGMVNTIYSSYITSGGGGNIDPPNSAPTMSPGSALDPIVFGSITVPTTVLAGGYATDADGDTLTYEISDASGYFIIDPNDGEVAISETAPVGVYNFDVRAGDGQDFSSWESYSIEVTAAANNAPVMGTSAQTINVVVGSTNMIVANNPATDADSDTLTYILGGADAANFVLDTDGSVTLAPAVPVGTYTFTLKANDGTVDSNTATFTVIVGNAPAPVTVLPRTGGTSSGKYGRAGTGVLNMINTPTKQYGHDFKNTGVAPLVLDKVVLLGRANQYTTITGMSVTIVDTPAVSPVTLVQSGGTLNLRHGDTEVRPSIRRDDGTPEVLNDFTITIPVGSTARVRWLEIIE